MMLALEPVLNRDRHLDRHLDRHNGPKPTAVLAMMATILTIRNGWERTGLILVNAARRSYRFWQCHRATIPNNPFPKPLYALALANLPLRMGVIDSVVNE
jgi:hypothetical protein